MIHHFIGENKFSIFTFFEVFLIHFLVSHTLGKYFSEWE